MAPEELIARKVTAYWERRGTPKSGTDWRDLATLLLEFFRTQKGFWSGCGAVACGRCSGKRLFDLAGGGALEIRPTDSEDFYASPLGIAV